MIKLRMIVALAVLTSCLWILILSGQTRRLDSPEELAVAIIRLEQRTDNLEGAMKRLEIGGSSTANMTAMKVGVLERDVLNQSKDIERLFNIVYGTIAFVVLQIILVVRYLLTNKFQDIERQHIKED